MDQTKEYNLDLSLPLRGTGAVYLIGFMGSGKSYWGKQLGQALGVPFFDLDEKIEENEERPITEIFAVEGEEYFRRIESEVLMMLTETHHSFVMATGGGTPCYFNNIDYMNKKGTTIWINCQVDCLFSRLVHEKEKRPLLKDLSDEQMKTYITKKLGDRKIFYQQASEILYEHELSLDNFLGRILQEEK
jgi:shikimate kinase